MNKRNASMAAAAAALALLVTAGAVHVVTGSDVPGGLQLQRKVSWSLSEIFINLDRVGALPAFAARAEYPLYLMKVQQTMYGNGADKVSPASFGQVYLGMTETAAIALLGWPNDRYELASSDVLRLRWRSKIDGYEVELDFRDGKLIQIR